jgi:hypothetical protein
VEKLVAEATSPRGLLRLRSWRGFKGWGPFIAKLVEEGFPFDSLIDRQDGVDFGASLVELFVDPWAHFSAEVLNLFVMAGDNGKHLLFLRVVQFKLPGEKGGNARRGILGVVKDISQRADGEDDRATGPGGDSGEKDEKAEQY